MTRMVLNAEEKARKLRVYHRLKREDKRSPGRYREAMEFKRVVYEESRLSLKDHAALEHAWDELERVYPPLLPDVEGVGAKLPGHPSPSALPESQAPAAPSVRYLGNLALPAEWPEIPDTAPYRDEVQWVYSNLVAIGSGKRLHLAKALSPPPSLGAVGMAKHYMGCTRDFYDKIAKPILGGIADESDGVNVRREKTQLSEIRQILEDLRKGEA